MRGLVISVKHLLPPPIDVRTTRGEVMQVGGLLTTCSLLHPGSCIQPPTQGHYVFCPPHTIHSAKAAGPARPTPPCEAATCQMISFPFTLYSVLFPFPRFSPMPHLGAEPAEQHQHTQPGPNLPMSLSLPVCAGLCRGPVSETSPISPSLISTFAVPVCWPPATHSHIRTQLPLNYRGTLNKKKTQCKPKICKKKTYSC